MIQMQLMEVTAPSNIPGTRVGGLSPSPSLMDVCRLHGVTEDVYSEGTHFRVRVHPSPLERTQTRSRFHGSRPP